MNMSTGSMNMHGTMDMSGTTMMNHMHHTGMAGMTHNHNGDGNHMGGMHMGGMDHSNSTCGSHMMMMYFHVGTCEYVLFKDLLVSTAGQMVGACIAIFFLAFFYEGLKVFREYLLQRALTPKYHSEATITKYSQSQDTMVIDPQIAKVNGQSVEKLADGNEYSQFSSDKVKGQHIISTAHFIQTVMHILQVLISYLLMLAFMTYNVWLCLAVVLGAGAGYFMFGWKRAVVVDVNEHCH